MAIRTVRDLNERAWYRFLKVVYVFLVLPYFLVLILVVREVGRDWHDAVYPSDAQEAFDDIEFHKLSDIEKIRVLKNIDEDFRGLPYGEQIQVIREINTNPKLQGRVKKSYIYDAYQTWNYQRSFIWGVVLTLVYWGSIEVIKL